MAGFKYPLDLDKYGSIVLTDSYQDTVREAILSALSTRTEERVWWPDYGLDDMELRTAYPLSKQLIPFRKCLNYALAEFPDVSYELQASVNDTGVLTVYVLYAIAGYDDDTLEYTVG